MTPINFLQMSPFFKSSHSQPGDDVRSVFPGLGKKTWTGAQRSNVLFSDKSQFCMSFGNQGPRVWTKWRGTESMLLKVQRKGKGTKNWFNDHGVSVPAKFKPQDPNHKMGFFSRGRWKNTRPNNADDRKAAIKATWSSITPQQCHSVITSMPCCITAVIQTNGGPVKYRVHRHELSLK